MLVIYDHVSLFTTSLAIFLVVRCIPASGRGAGSFQRCQHSPCYVMASYKLILSALYAYSPFRSTFSTSRRTRLLRTPFVLSVVDPLFEMAPLMIGVTGHVPLPTCTPIIEAPKVQGPTQNVERFDPKKHLAYGVPSKTYTMRDLGYSEDTGVSPVAVSGPFPLFTTEAIEVMRAEILRPEIQDKFKYSSNIAPCQLRGYAKK